MNQKQLLILLALIVLLGGGWFAFIKRQIALAPTTSPSITEPASPSDPTPIDTSDWKTYRNEEFGFEVRLPKNFEKTEQGFTPLNPPVGNPESLENNVWFEVDEKRSVYWKDFSGKRVQNLSDDDFIYPAEKKYRKSGALEVSFERKKVNGIYLVIVSSLQKNEPGYDTGGGWIEGGWNKEAFFDCKDSICSIAIHSHIFSKEKETLFSTVIETLKY